MKKLIGIIAILTIILYMGVQNNQVLLKLNKMASH